MSKLLQIREEDLAELERILPQIFDQVTMRVTATPKDRTQFRVVQKILTNVRWNYGPPEEVTEISGQ